VVIKVRRPGIIDDIKKDLEILEWLTRLLEPSKAEETKSVLADIKRMILNETDFASEVKNMLNMSEVYPDILIPQVFTEMCSQDVIVMKYVPSNKFSTTKKTEMAYILMDTFIEQFLQHGLIHGDPHEGNVALSSYDENVLVMYDLGHVVRLDPSTRSLMKVLVFEMMLENVDGVVEVMESMPEIITIKDKTQIKKFVKRYIEYIKTIDVQLLSSLDSRDEALPLKFSSTVFEIVRIFGIVEGVCLSLDPDFEYNKVFYKYVDRLVLDRDFLEYKASKDLIKIMKWIM
jgi:predicted unusual protein kinase regulating ubiquinone biosynthesis (AarF/ABC1/UbiB family)